MWTGTNIDGLAKGDGLDCNNWSDNTDNYSGWAGQTAYFNWDDWIDSFDNHCDEQWFGLYCISQ